MNKYIKYDLEDGVNKIRIAIMNSFHAILREETSEIELNHAPISLFIKCIKDIGFTYSIGLDETNSTMFIGAYDENGTFKLKVEIDYLTGKVVMHSNNVK